MSPTRPSSLIINIPPHRSHDEVATATNKQNPKSAKQALYFAVGSVISLLLAITHLSIYRQSLITTTPNSTTHTTALTDNKQTDTLSEFFFLLCPILASLSAYHCSNALKELAPTPHSVA